MTALEPPQTSIAMSKGISEEEKNRRTSRVGLITSLVSLSLALGILWIAFTRTNTLIVIPAIGLLASFLLQILISQGMFAKTSTARVFAILLSSQAALITFCLFFSGTALLVAGIILMFSLISSVTLLDEDKGDAVLPISLMSSLLAGTLGTYPPVAQLSVPVFNYLTGGIFVILVIVFIVLMTAGLIVANLRVKITIGALLIVIAPLSLLTLIDSSYLRKSLMDETQANLMNSSRLLAARVDEFVLTNRASIASETRLPVFANYLNLNLGQRPGSAQEKQLLTAIESIKAAMKVKEIAYLDSFKLLDRNGFIAYSSRSSEIGANEKSRSYFDMPMTTGQVYDSPVEFSPYDGKPYIYFSQVVKTSSQEIVGVFVTVFDARILQSIAKEYVNENLQESYPIILDENFLRLADPQDEKLVYTTLVPLSDEIGRLLKSKNRLPNLPLASLSANQPDFAARLQNVDKQPFFTANVSQDGETYYTAAEKLTSQNWYVSFVRDRSSVEDLLTNQTRLSIIIATMIAGAISILATYIAQIFSSPITQLTLTAQQVSSGDLEARSTISSKDEVGILAGAFNAMTSQLKMFISGLEERVQERTRELAERNDALSFRARQLETIADVARGITQTQSLENLLTSMTQLISERFNFYHVGIFLIEPSGKFAVLRAANSEGGQRMLARQHRLEVGQTGIVGYTTATGEARIATDVGQDAVYFNNPDLPLTRSEMALPLVVADRVIGALDVQSAESAAFSQDDIQVFKILADQAAIAIYNNQLYTETRQALEEAHQVHQRYLQQEWGREMAQNPHSAYRYTPAGISALPEAEQDGIGAVLETGEIQVEEQTGESGSRHVLIVPVKLRGETIGAIRIQEDGSEGHAWAEEEVLTVQTVADQVALALENARLFNQTTRKAERERRVLEITSRIRSTNDPQIMMQIAVEEIQRALRASRAQVVLQPADPDGSGNEQKKNPSLAAAE